MVVIDETLAAPWGSSFDWLTQNGTRASTSAMVDLASASCSADRLVYQPPWVKPIAMVATAPNAAPIRPGASEVRIFMGSPWGTGRTASALRSREHALYFAG